MTGKTHFRKVFKSDHLGQADLEDLIEQGSNLIFTIKQVKQEMDVRVAGHKGNHNIAYFQEPIKPMVLNATNSKALRGLSGGSPFVEDWGGIAVQLYIDPSVKMKGDVVGGVRINPNPVQATRKVITRETEKLWNNAKAAYNRDGNLNAVLEKCDMSMEDQAALIDEAQNEALA
jgi:hypothetical protein